MRLSQLLFAAAILLFGCSEAPLPEPPPNRWSDVRLWPVLEAQEHRDTKTLCSLLQDSAATVREAAALAFASVQDSASIPCLLGRLGDARVEVRATAVFGLGLIADSSAVEKMAEWALQEKDSTVQRALFSASFRAMQRNGMLTDANAILYFLERSRGQDRVRAADALRKLPDSTFQAMSTEYLTLIGREVDPQVRSTLIRGLGRMRNDAKFPVLYNSLHADQSLSVRIQAIQTLAQLPEKNVMDTVLRLLNDPERMIRKAVVSALSARIDALTVPTLIRSSGALDSDPMIRYPFYGTLLRIQRTHALVMDSLELPEKEPYAEAERIKARANDPIGYHDEELETIMKGSAHPAVRLAAFEGLVLIMDQRMMMPRALSYDMQVSEAAPFWHMALETGDAGLVAAAAEHLQLRSSRDLTVLFPPVVEAKARIGLQPIRDLEAIGLLDHLAAKRDGRPPPPRYVPTFNHSIDPLRLRALKQGQRYRIVTAKGEVIITTDVNECPGSSLVFDSLVVAGYYNGKAFHRMVPDFVVQGGCPRGDGYGGMPWTLRTEIGRTGFSAGSVGLASAGRDTESCQFFITHTSTPTLDGRYTRFGEVVSGMDVVWRLGVGDVMARVERME